MLRTILVAILLFGVARVGLAAAVVHRTEADMCRAARAIVRGEITQVSARRHPSGLIVTEVVVAVTRGLKGHASHRPLAFTLLGGTLGDTTLHVAGSSRYIVGEEVVLFLEQGGEGLVELGIGAGKYRVERDGTQARVTRVWGGAQAVQPGAGSSSIGLATPSAQSESLTTFEARILAQVEL